MKLRIKGDSLRLRISPSEMTRLLEFGRVEETIHFGLEQDARLTYALETVDHGLELSSPIAVRYQSGQVQMLVSAARAQAWANGNEVGVYSQIVAGDGYLELALEKDFACLDTSDDRNSDTFPNPRQGSPC